MPSPNPLQNLSDDELVAHFIRTDTDAEIIFQIIYDRHWWTIYHYVFRRIREQSPSEDIVQEIFLAIWQNRTKLDKDKVLLAYLFTAARNKVYDLLKKDDRIGEYLRWARELLPGSDNLLEEKVSTDELEKMIFTYVRQMPEKGKEAFLLSRENGMSVAEVAQKLQISPKTVEWHIAKVSRQLRLFLESDMLLLISLQPALYLHFLCISRHLTIS
jgi:RNA polymerase sigma-70 factor (family 1)